MAADNVSEAHARSVAAPTAGFCDATTSTSDETVDLSDYKGRYVKIYCETEDHYIAFTDDATDTIVTTAQNVGTAMVPDRVASGAQGVDLIVPKNKPILVYRTVSGTGVIRVLPR